MLGTSAPGRAPDSGSAPEFGEESMGVVGAGLTDAFGSVRFCRLLFTILSSKFSSAEGLAGVEDDEDSGCEFCTSEKNRGNEGKRVVVAKYPLEDASGRSEQQACLNTCIVVQRDEMNATSKTFELDASALATRKSANHFTSNPIQVLAAMPVSSSHS